MSLSCQIGVIINVSLRILEFLAAYFKEKITSKCNQEIPQSQTAVEPEILPRKAHTTITRHQQDKQSKATRSLPYHDD